MVNTVVKYQRKPRYQRYRAATTTIPMPKYISPLKQRSIVYQNDIKGPEKKNIDVNTTGSALPAVAQFAAAPILLNDIPGGSDPSQRVGRRVLMKSIMFRWSVNTAGTTGSYRVLVVYDKQTNGALPATTSIVDNIQHYAAMNLSNSDRYVTLFDELISIQDVNFKTLYRKVNLEAIFSATAAGIGSIASGGVYLCLASAQARAGDVINFASRIRYTDI